MLLTSVASAQSTSATESFSTSSRLQCLSSTGIFDLPDFDTSLGTLESVSVTLTITSCSKIRVYNTSSTPESFTDASMTFNSSVTGPDSLELNLSPEAILASGTAKPGLNVFKVGKTTTTTTSSADSGSLSLWENQSGDMVDIDYTKGSATFQGTDLGDDLLFGGKVRGKEKLTVQYTYLSDSSDPTNPVVTPEPSAKYLSGLAAGAMALLLLGRKRRSDSMA